jgi:hypothetical protein
MLTAGLQACRGLIAVALDYLARINFHFAFAFASIDAAIFEIDPCDIPTITGQIDRVGTRSFRKAMVDFWAERLTVMEGDDHTGNFDGRVFDPELNLSEPSFVAAHFDAVVVVSEIHVALAEEHPSAGCLGCGGEAGSGH